MADKCITDEDVAKMCGSKLLFAILATFAAMLTHPRETLQMYRDMK